MESTAVVFFLEKSQYFLLSRTLFRQGATAPKSWQVPPVITGGVGEDTHIKSYYSRRKTKYLLYTKFLINTKRIKYICLKFS